MYTLNGWWFLSSGGSYPPAEIYPGIATEPVGGTGLKATGSDASRS